MTGPIPQVNRQLSSTTTTGNPNMDTTYRSKFRRSSSADDYNSFESKLNNNQHNEIIFFKREHTTSDVDSGTEEIEQQMDQLLITTFNDKDDNSSTKSFGPNPDEGFSECEHEEGEPKISLAKRDLELAEKIPAHMKKDFCHDTSVAFHGEFARLISIPLSLYHDVRYYLFAQEEIGDSYMNLIFQYVKLDNAKAQFKCPNTYCQHAWTSMRARISFSITGPDTGFIVLKIFGQNCQLCGTHADALWYIDEVCRVMKNLAKAIFETYFPDMLNNVDLTYEEPVQSNGKQSRHSNHDPTQRKGKMFAPHNKQYCEACQLGLCFS